MIKKIFLILLLLTIYTQAIDLDAKVLQKIVDDNPQAVKEKVLLAKYYMQHGNDLKAMALVNSALKQDKNNKYAKNMRQSLVVKEENKNFFRTLHLTYPIKSKDAEVYLKTQYTKNNYKLFAKAYQAFVNEKVLLEDIYYINAAYIYLWDGKYVLSKEALDHVKQKNNLEKTKIEADICYYTGKYSCAIILFEKLYSLNKDIETGIKLVYSYYYMGELDKAKRLYTELFEREPKNSALKKVSKQFTKLDKKREILAKEKYEKLRDIASLRDYCSILYGLNKKKETLNLLKIHNKQYATNTSYLLEATYLSWTNHFKDAMTILKPLVVKNNLDAILLAGKIASWEGNFVQAKKYLNNAVQLGKDKKFIYESKKALAFVYKWEKENEKAKKLFLELLKEDKNDNEVVEAIMELNGDYKSLIKIYKNKASGAGNVKRLSELYFHNGEQDKAIEALKVYLKDKPHDLEATKSLALMLIDKKEFYSGFGNLEYYAAQKNDQNSSMLLAQQYYWRGFSKEAVDVLDTLLSKYPKNKEAQELRAKILKVSPRFTTSNSGATVNDYFQTVGLKQLEIADALYFNGHHGASLMYYENYLSEEPDNHNVRLRYAFALENAGQYAKAEGEFALMLWNNDTDEINYHYGYNLMMNHKLDKAEKVFRKLKQNILNPIEPKLNTFVQDWKKAWESKEFSKYAKFYSENIRDDEMWALSKQQKFNDVTFISVGLYDIVSKKTKTDNRYIVKFYEEITTNKGTKKGNTVLEIVCNTNKTECQIDKESFIKGTYSKFVSLEPILNQRLKDIKIFRKNPDTLKRIIRKKKRL